VDLSAINYRNVRNYCKKSIEEAAVVAFVDNIEYSYRRNKNIVIADPFDFEQAAKRVDQGSGKIE
jgi:hypothetical protein